MLDTSLAVSVNELTKRFSYKTNKSISKYTPAWLTPEKNTITAVDNISFQIKKGEKIAFIGPNGAGKSTTIKMLTGILTPTLGEISVLGYTPISQRKKLSYKMSAIFGQRSQLWQLLPIKDSFFLLADMFDIENNFAKKRINKLIDLFGVEKLIPKTPQQLSLGERMKCELIAGLIHSPEILFLDEPTIGLDVTIKATVRDLIKALSEEESVTVILTSHDTGDIEQVCDRTIIINTGQIIFDDTVANLRANFIKKKLITVKYDGKITFPEFEGITNLSNDNHELKLSIDLEQTTVEKVLNDILKQGSINDITVEDTPLEDVIKKIYGAPSFPS